MKSNPVEWFEIYVQDMSRAKGFYQGVLGYQLEAISGPDLEMLAFPSDAQAGGASGALVRAPNMPSGGNSTLVYFSCKDCAVEEARIEDHGGRVERSKMSLGEHGFCTIAIDSEGNMFGLHSMA